MGPYTGFHIPVWVQSVLSKTSFLCSHMTWFSLVPRRFSSRCADLFSRFLFRFSSRLSVSVFLCSWSCRSVNFHHRSRQAAPSFSSVVVFCADFRVFSTGVSAQARKCFPLTPKHALALSLPPAVNNSSWHGFLSTRPWSLVNARTGHRCRVSGLRFSCRYSVVGLDSHCSILRWPLASSFPRSSKLCAQLFSADRE
jgi:hypothetical protein